VGSVLRRYDRRALNVVAVVEAVREAHPELARPLTITSLRRVLEREEIDVIRRPIPAYAYVEGGLGSYVIVLKAGLNPRHERRVLAHEYAHIKLHYESSGEVQFQRTPCRRGDPRELEAELFMRLLLLGESATPDHPDVAPLVAAISARETLRRRPAQINLELPEHRLSVRDRLLLAMEDSLVYGEQKRQRRGLPPVKHRAPSAARRHEDFDRTGYDDSMHAPWVRDVADRKWWIFNLARRIVDGRATWERLLDSMSPEISHRVFLSAAGERRVYVFKDRRESRAHRVMHLDRQLAEATKLKARTARPTEPHRTDVGSRN
jgi:hypothetical protein